MLVPTSIYFYGASMLFGVGFSLAIISDSSIAAAGAFIGSGLMCIANAIASFSKQKPAEQNNDQKKVGY